MVTTYQESWYDVSLIEPFWVLPQELEPLESIRNVSVIGQMEKIAADHSKSHLVETRHFKIEIVSSSHGRVKDEGGQDHLNEEDHGTLEKVVFKQVCHIEI